MELTVHDDWDEVRDPLEQEELEASERELARERDHERWVVSE